MHFWVIFANIIAISPRFTGVFKVGDVCRHRAGVSKVATFPEPVSVVNRRSTQTFLYLLTYIWRPGRNSFSSWLDHVGSSECTACSLESHEMDAMDHATYGDTQCRI